MALLYAGSATIDEQMGLRKADEVFYQYMSQNIYGSVRSCIHPDDFHRFQDAFEEVKENRVAKNIITLRKLNSDDSFEWLLVELSKEPFASKDQPLFHLNLSSLSKEQTDAHHLVSLNREYETFFNLFGGTLLTYDIGSGVIHVFTNCNQLQTHIPTKNHPKGKSRRKCQSYSSSGHETLLAFVFRFYQKK